MSSLVRAVSPRFTGALVATPALGQVTLTLPSATDYFGTSVPTLTRLPAFPSTPILEGTTYVDTTVADGQSYTYSYFLTDQRGLVSAVQTAVATVPSSAPTPIFTLDWDSFPTAVITGNTGNVIRHVEGDGVISVVTGQSPPDGTKAFKSQVTYDAGDTQFRAEARLITSGLPVLGTPYWYRTHIKFPLAIAGDTRQTVVLQWHTGGTTGHHDLHLTAGKLGIKRHGATEANVEFDLSVTADVWYEFLIRAVWSVSSTGRFELFRDRVRIYDSGPSATHASGDALLPFPKMGCYKWPWKFNAPVGSESPCILYHSSKYLIYNGNTVSYADWGLTAP